MKRITIKDVAAHAGVSSATVSRALDDRPEISLNTKNRVRESCQELGYVPNIAARGLVKKQAHTIGLVVPDVTNPYFSTIALTAEMTARNKGYRVLFCNSMRSAQQEAEVVESLLQNRVDGLIIAPVSPESQQKLQRMTGNLPCIYLGNNHDDNCSYIVVDNKKGAYEGTKYLLSLGHKKISYLGGRDNSRTRMYRIRGFEEAMNEAGLLGSNIPCPPAVDFFQANYGLAYKLLSGADIPTAVFAFSDLTALGILKAAEDRGIRVPEDLSILGFDNITISALPRIDLTTVSQNKQEIGRLAVDRIFEKIAGNSEKISDIMEPELIIRSSCREV